MIKEMIPGPRKPRDPDEIRSPEKMRPGAALFREAEEMLSNITPEMYLRPKQDVMRTARVLGPATHRIKQLYTLHEQLLIETDTLHKELLASGIQGNERKFQELNRKNLIQRAVHAALGYEVSKEFDSFGEPFTIDINWNVVTKER